MAPPERHGRKRLLEKIEGTKRSALHDPFLSPEVPKPTDTINKGIVVHAEANNVVEHVVLGRIGLPVPSRDLHVPSPRERNLVPPRVLRRHNRTLPAGYPSHPGKVATATPTSSLDPQSKTEYRSPPHCDVLAAFRRLEDRGLLPPVPGALSYAHAATGRYSPRYQTINEGSSTGMPPKLPPIYNDPLSLVPTRPYMRPRSSGPQQRHANVPAGGSKSCDGMPRGRP